MENSQFITERFFHGAKDSFPIDFGNQPVRATLDQTKKFAGWMVGALDEVATKFMWNGFYEKAIAEEALDPIRYADDWTRKMVAGRGIGEVPLAQKSQFAKIVMPFQLELTNLWWVLKDQMKRKDFIGIALFIVASYVMNRGAEEVRGSDVSFDPLNALLEGFDEFKADDDWKHGLILGFGRFGGEIVSNAPFGQTVASLYPQYGINIPGIGTITRAEFFGNGDPTRYGGSGLISQQAYQDPLFKLITPFAGGQIEKSIQGTQNFIKGKNESPGGKSDFNIEKTPVNFVKSLLFGKYATQDAREFFARNDTPEAKIIANEKAKAKEKADATKQDAENVYASIMDAPKDKRAALFGDLLNSDPDMAKSVAHVAELDKSGWSYTERQLESSGIENGVRALSMQKILDRLPTKEQKKAQFAEWIDKGLVTEDVAAQVSSLYSKKDKTEVKAYSQTAPLAEEIKTPDFQYYAPEKPIEFPKNLPQVQTFADKVMAKYPLTPAAKEIITRTPIALADPANRGAAAQTEYDRQGNPTQMVINSIKNPQDEQNLAHEFFNTIFLSNKTDVDGFNAAWEKAQASDHPNAAVIKKIDKILNDPANTQAFFGTQPGDENIGTNPLQLATERFGYAGDMLGLDGIEELPPELRPFYENVLTK